MVRLLGIDPGLRFTGWGLIEADGNRLRHRADGVIATDAATPVPDRLRVLHDALAALLAEWQPDEAAIEETYVNRNGAATLKLGYARGVALLAPARLGYSVEGVGGGCGACHERNNTYLYGNMSRRFFIRVANFHD